MVLWKVTAAVSLLVTMTLYCLIFQEYLKPVFQGNDEEAKKTSKNVLYPFHFVIAFIFTPMLSMEPHTEIQEEVYKHKDFEECSRTFVEK